MPRAYKLPSPGEPFDPELFKLGKPCKRNHIHADGMTLRRLSGQCPICDRIDSQERQRQYRQDPEHKRKAAAYVAERRRLYGRTDRQPKPPEWHEQRQVQSALRRTGKLPTVAELVQQQQWAYWVDHPETKAAQQRQWRLDRQRFRYLTDTSYRLYHRAKSKGYKVAAKDPGRSTDTPLAHIPPTLLLQRWAEFGHRCAYCRASGDLQIEHVIPISKGGTNDLGNIVPACRSCNSSKRSRDAHEWFAMQTFYDRRRWERIVEALAKFQANPLGSA